MRQSLERLQLQVEELAVGMGCHKHCLVAAQAGEDCEAVARSRRAGELGDGAVESLVAERRRPGAAL